MFFFMILQLGVGENWVPPESSRSSSAISIFSKGVFGAPNFWTRHDNLNLDKSQQKPLTQV